MNDPHKFGTMNFKNNLVSIDGPTHENGGVKLSKTKEVEGEESMFGNFVFSERLSYPKSKMSFSDKAKAIEKKYGKDKSDFAIKSKKKEMQRLADEQEALKAEILGSITPTMDEEGVEKFFIGGAVASAAGSLINVGRGLFEKPREYDPIELQRAEYKEAEFENVDFDTIDLSDQRSLNALQTDSNRKTTNAFIRGNASSAGQLLNNTMVNNLRSQSQLNTSNRESYLNEEVTNTNILNSEDQINTQINNSEEQFNVGNFLNTNMFNTGIHNQELMQNFDIQLMNDANKDAKRELLYQGIGGLLQTGGMLAGDISAMKSDNAMLKSAYPNADPNMLKYRR